MGPVVEHFLFLVSCSEHHCSYLYLCVCPLFSFNKFLDVEPLGQWSAKFLLGGLYLFCKHIENSTPLYFTLNSSSKFAVSVIGIEG